MNIKEFKNLVDQKYPNHSGKNCFDRKVEKYDYIYGQTITTIKENDAIFKTKNYKLITQALRKSNNLKEAEENILEAVYKISKTEYYEIKIRTSKKSSFFIYREFAEKEGKFFKTEADIASVMIFNKSTQIFLKGNGIDGTQRISLLNEDIRMIPSDKKGSNPMFMTSFCLKEKGYISSYDCEEEPLYHLDEGHYLALNAEGIIFLQKIK